jgi:hypothetical protein
LVIARFAAVTAGEVLDVLTPIWFDRPETAKRVLQRMEAVFKSAILRGHRETASPCIGVAQELGTKHRKVEHHPSLPYQYVPAFLERLRAAPPARRPRPKGHELPKAGGKHWRGQRCAAAATSGFDEQEGFWGNKKNLRLGRRGQVWNKLSISRAETLEQAGIDGVFSIQHRSC